MSEKTKKLLEKALIRALWTVAQTALGFITIGMTVSEVEWMHILSVSVVAGVYSLIKSVVIGLPEVSDEDFTQE